MDRMKSVFDVFRQSVHTEAHVSLFGGRARDGAAGAGSVRQLVRLACGGLGVDSDTAWSEAHTAPAARVAAGAVLDLAVRTARGDLRNGYARARHTHATRTPHAHLSFIYLIKLCTVEFIFAFMFHSFYKHFLLF